MTLTDERLWDYPFLHMTGHGNIKFTDTEVVRLREYLLRGGFLHVDDNYGLDTAFRREIARVFPDRAAGGRPLDASDIPLVYDFPEGPAEDPRARRQARARFRHLPRRPARRVLSYSSDLGNGWEDPEMYKDPAGAARGRAAHGGQPLRLRRDEPAHPMTRHRARRSRAAKRSPARADRGPAARRGRRDVDHRSWRRRARRRALADAAAHHAVPRVVRRARRRGGTRLANARATAPRRDALAGGARDRGGAATAARRAARRVGAGGPRTRSRRARRRRREERCRGKARSRRHFESRGTDAR